MGTLLTIELLQTIFWLCGVIIAAAVDGGLPFGTLSLATANKVCWPLGIATYWLELMNSMWHAVLAWKIWSWIYRRQPVYRLQRILGYSFWACLAVATALTAVPVAQRSIGLTPHANCFLSSLYLRHHKPSLSFVLDRWIVLPICWLVVLLFNSWSIYVLRTETRYLSAKRLQTRLLLVTISFSVLWGLMMAPLYMEVPSFQVDFWLRVSESMREKSVWIQVYI